MTIAMEAVAETVVDAAVAEAKAWLRIETADDDAALAALARAAIGMAEDFCARILFARAGVETLDAAAGRGRGISGGGSAGGAGGGSGWPAGALRLEVCPVRTVGAVRLLVSDGSVDAGTTDAEAAGATLLDAGDYAVALDAEGDGWFRLLRAGLSGRISIVLRAGMAEDWDALPAPLRQGVVRLVAHLFAESASEAPPAIVGALWRPWRRMRLG